jgi:transcriptional regulator with XRE-family HTH domain
MPDKEPLYLDLPGDPSALGKALKKLRKLAQVSGPQMAEHCDVSNNAVYAWEGMGNIKAADLVTYMDRLGFKITIKCPPQS